MDSEYIIDIMAESGSDIEPDQIIQCYPLEKDMIEAINLHQEWLNTSGKYGKQLMIIDKKLLYFDFSGQRLSNASLLNCDLSYCNFTGANLDGANLLGSCIKGAKFHYASMIGTEFYMKDLELT